jgi:hypothetical protein
MKKVTSVEITKFLDNLCDRLCDQDGEPFGHGDIEECNRCISRNLISKFNITRKSDKNNGKRTTEI